MSPDRKALVTHAQLYIKHRGLSEAEELAEKWTVSVEAQAAHAGWVRGFLVGGFAVALIALVLR